MFPARSPTPAAPALNLYTETDKTGYKTVHICEVRTPGMELTPLKKALTLWLWVGPLVCCLLDGRDAAREQSGLKVYYHGGPDFLPGLAGVAMKKHIHRHVMARATPEQQRLLRRIWAARTGSELAESWLGIVNHEERAVTLVPVFGSSYDYDGDIQIGDTPPEGWRLDFQLRAHRSARTLSFLERLFVKIVECSQAPAGTFKEFLGDLAAVLNGDQGDAMVMQCLSSIGIMEHASIDFWMERLKTVNSPGRLWCP